MKKLAYLFSLLVFLILACNLPLFTTPAADNKPAPLPNTPVVAKPTDLPVIPLTLTTAPTMTPKDISVDVGNISFVIPDGLATGAASEIIARAEGDQVAPWDVAPERTKFLLENYILQNKFHKPQIYIYPAQDFAAMADAVSNNIKRIQKAVANPNALKAEYVFYPVFQRRTDVRVLTEYGQSFGLVNNHGMFYHFQGLTSDSKYYIIAILPITSPMLVSDDNPESPVPSDGVPFNYSDPNFDFPGYMNAVSAKLNTAAPETFSPTMTTLDALIQSIQVTP